MLVGMGLFSTMRIGTPIGVLAVYQVVQGVGMGLLYSTYVRLVSHSSISVPYEDGMLSSL